MGEAEAIVARLLHRFGLSVLAGPTARIPPPVSTGATKGVEQGERLMAKAVYCIAGDVEQAEAIVDGLKVLGFDVDDISVLFPDRSGTKDFAHEKATKAPEGAVTGGGAGGVVGGTLGLLAGIGALTIPGVGPLIAAGPIMAALSGVAVGGAVGGLTGALVGAGMPEFEAKRYAGKVKDGNILISVHTQDRDQVPAAKALFEKAGATDISTGGDASPDD